MVYWVSGSVYFGGSSFELGFLFYSVTIVDDDMGKNLVESWFVEGILLGGDCNSYLKFEAFEKLNSESASYRGVLWIPEIRLFWF